MKDLLDARKLAIAGALLAAAALSWWLARTGSLPLPQVAAPVPHEPEAIIERFTATAMNERGQPRYRLSATRLVRYRDDGSHELDAPYLIQYGDGTPVHTRARRGWMPADKSLIDMRGDVLVARGRDPNAAPGEAPGAIEVRAESMRVRLDR